jgi:hypothetical protein
MKSMVILKRHVNKCQWKHPPGTEIYRKVKFYLLSNYSGDPNTKNSNSVTIQIPNNSVFHFQMAKPFENRNNKS